ncbi:aminoglycoside phosphotransferase family protein [Marinomonas algicola]|uniref:aminoglycoside phosphotransferase family protein n=1 Tax=Marinomonas algicola TaxID=2773454 RepID=UPI001747F9C2|nr:aminoglycoside phosphotransferase family protein [Marinomonas algicola]
MMHFGKVIGSGHCANVYEYRKNYVLKLFHKHIDPKVAQYEFDASHEINKLGIRTPAVYDLVKVGSQQGIIFQKIRGLTLIEDVSKSPFKLITHVKCSAQLFESVHQLSTMGLASFKEQLADRINQTILLTPSEKKMIINYLSTLEDGNDLCHGDFHFGNIMIAENNLHIIDWGGVARGPKIADLTLAIIQFQVSSIANNIPLYLKIVIILFRKLIIHTFIEAYCKENPHLTTKELKREIQRWRLPVASSRLISCNYIERKSLLKIISIEIKKQKNKQA